MEANKVELTIKWNKDTLQVTATESDTLDDFRGLIYSVTQVQPEKQKIIFKGKVLKDGAQCIGQMGIVNVI